MAPKHGSVFARIEPDRFAFRTRAINKTLCVGTYEENWNKSVVDGRVRQSMNGLSDQELILLHKVLTRYVEQIEDIDSAIPDKPVNTGKTFKDTDEMKSSEDIEIEP